MFPPEIWLTIADHLLPRQTARIAPVSSLFADIASDARFRSLVIDDSTPTALLSKLTALPAHAHRVRSLEIHPAAIYAASARLKRKSTSQDDGPGGLAQEVVSALSALSHLSQLAIKWPHMTDSADAALCLPLLLAVWPCHCTATNLSTLRLDMALVHFSRLVPPLLARHPLPVRSLHIRFTADHSGSSTWTSHQHTALERISQLISHFSSTLTSLSISSIAHLDFTPLYAQLALCHFPRLTDLALQLPCDPRHLGDLGTAYLNTFLRGCATTLERLEVAPQYCCFESLLPPKPVSSSSSASYSPFTSTFIPPPPPVPIITPTTILPPAAAAPLPISFVPNNNTINNPPTTPSTLTTNSTNNAGPLPYPLSTTPPTPPSPASSTASSASSSSASSSASSSSTSTYPPAQQHLPHASSSSSVSHSHTPPAAEQTFSFPLPTVTPPPTNPPTTTNEWLDYLFTNLSLSNVHALVVGLNILGSGGGKVLPVTRRLVHVWANSSSPLGRRKKLVVQGAIAGEDDLRKLFEVDGVDNGVRYDGGLPSGRIRRGSGRRPRPLEVSRFGTGSVSSTPIMGSPGLFSSPLASPSAHSTSFSTSTLAPLASTSASASAFSSFNDSIQAPPSTPPPRGLGAGTFPSSSSFSTPSSTSSPTSIAPPSTPPRFRTTYTPYASYTSHAPHTTSLSSSSSLPTTPSSHSTHRRSLGLLNRPTSPPLIHWQTHLDVPVLEMETRTLSLPLLRTLAVLLPGLKELEMVYRWLDTSTGADSPAIESGTRTSLGAIRKEKGSYIDMEEDGDIDLDEDSTGAGDGSEDPLSMWSLEKLEIECSRWDSDEASSTSPSSSLVEGGVAGSGRPKTTTKRWEWQKGVMQRIRGGGRGERCAEMDG